MQFKQHTCIKVTVIVNENSKMYYFEAVYNEASYSKCIPRIVKILQIYVNDLRRVGFVENIITFSPAARILTLIYLSSMLWN